MADVALRSLRKSYGDTEVLHGIDLHVGDGEFVVLVGPSGCGKSTTLRMIAGLEDITGGEIAIGGRVVNNLEPKARDIAMVFQNYAIYPHMSVRRNIAFGLRSSSMPRADKAARVEEVAGFLEMTDYLERKPAALSGGQRQRVAIGRAMVRDPAVFLFDEPLSNLDAQLRTQMRLEIKKLHQRVGTTIVFVTHDQVEAMTLADRIVIMRDGVIRQVGTPAEVYHEPADTFVARFIGAPAMNLLEANVSGGLARLRGGNGSDGGAVPVDAPDGPLTLGIRPDDLHPAGEGAALVEGTVAVLEPLGAETLVYVDTPAGEIVAKADGRRPPAVGTPVRLAAEPGTVHAFGPDGAAIARPTALAA